MYAFSRERERERERERKRAEGVISAAFRDSSDSVAHLILTRMWRQAPCGAVGALEKSTKIIDAGAIDWEMLTLAADSTGFTGRVCRVHDFSQSSLRRINWSRRT